MTGSHVPVTQTPAFAVTWNNVNREFAALVGHHDSRSIKAWTYSFAPASKRPGIRFWQLDPGRYRLSVLPDNNFDGKPDGAPLETIDFDCVERLTEQDFALPPRELCLLEVTQLEALPRGDALRPDIALTGRDIQLLDAPRRGAECRGRLTLHNIGAAEATDLKIELKITPATDHIPHTFTRSVAKLSWPDDLTPRRHAVEFTWTPRESGRHCITASVKCSSRHREICTLNNQASLSVKAE